jgi:hypothetical protein
MRRRVANRLPALLCLCYEAASPNACVLSLMHARLNYCVGVYDVTIHMQKWPHLEDHAKKAMSSILVVHDIMVQNPIVFREVTLLWCVSIVAACYLSEIPWGVPTSAALASFSA